MEQYGGISSSGSNIQENNKRSLFSYEQLNKAIVYIAGGSLIFSVGFVEKIVKFSHCTNNKLLMLSWIFFAMTLILNLLSYVSSAISINGAIAKKTSLERSFNIVTFIIDCLSVLLLLTGLIIFIIFVNNNLHS